MFGVDVDVFVDNVCLVEGEDDVGDTVGPRLFGRRRDGVDFDRFADAKVAGLACSTSVGVIVEFDKHSKLGRRANSKLYNATSKVAVLVDDRSVEFFLCKVIRRYKPHV